MKLQPEEVINNIRLKCKAEDAMKNYDLIVSQVYLQQLPKYLISLQNKNEVPD